MKSKLLLTLFIALTASSFSLKAQDKKMSEMQIKQQQDQFKDRYEAQKKTIQTAYNMDMKALEAQKNLTPAQRKEQMDIIKDRYEMQKKANQTTYKNDKNNLKEKREVLNNGKHEREEKHEGKEKHEGQEKKIMKTPPVKHVPKPVKH